MTEMEASREMWKGLAVFFLSALAIFMGLTVGLAHQSDAVYEKLNAVCASLSESSSGSIREWNEIVYCLDVRGAIDHEASLHFRKYQEE